MDILIAVNPCVGKVNSFLVTVRRGGSCNTMRGTVHALVGASPSVPPFVSGWTGFPDPRIGLLLRSRRLLPAGILLPPRITRPGNFSPWLARPSTSGIWVSLRSLEAASVVPAACLCLGQERRVGSGPASLSRWSQPGNEQPEKGKAVRLQSSTRKPPNKQKTPKPKPKNTHNNNNKNITSNHTSIPEENKFRHTLCDQKCVPRA